MPGGAPTKFVPDVRERIVKALRLGMPHEQAALYGRVAYGTYREWIVRGEKDLQAGEDTPHAKFSEECRLAEAEALMGWLAYIEQAAQRGDWKAAAWKAERRFQKAFALQGQGQLNVAILVQQVVQKVTELLPSPEAQLELAARIERGEVLDAEIVESPESLERGGIGADAGPAD